MKSKKGNGNISVFLVCLLISILFWGLSKLSKTYTDQITYPLFVTNVPDSLVITSQSDKHLDLLLEGKGFELLKWKYISKKQAITLDFNKSNHKKIQNRFIAEFDLKDIANRKVKENNFAKNMTNFSPEKLILELKKNSKNSSKHFKGSAKNQ